MTLTCRRYLILLDQCKLVTLEEGCASIDCVGGAGVQLCGLTLVDGSVACLLKLGRQEVVKVIALNLLPKGKTRQAQAAVCRCKSKDKTER